MRLKPPLLNTLISMDKKKATDFIKGNITKNSGELYFESPVLRYPIPDKFSRLHKYVGKEIILGIRPEHVRINEKLSGPIFRAHVAVIEPLGPTTVIFASLDIDTELTIIQEGLVEYNIEEEIEIQFNADFIHFFDINTEIRILPENKK